MRSLRRLGLVAVALLLAPGTGLAQSLPRAPGAGAPAAPRTETEGPDAAPSAKSKSNLPTVRIGALLPLSGSSAWFGKELRQGMELAIADLERPPAPDAAGTPEPDVAGTPAPEPGIRLVLEAADVLPPNPKQITDAFGRVASGAPVVFTASPTPTLAVQPLAAGRDVLLVHLGLPTGRLTAGSRAIILARPTIPARVAGLASLAAEQPARRVALLAAGDEFGKAVRAALTAAWRERGAALAYEESLTVEAPDLPSRLRALVRAAPDAVVLGFRGPDLGDLATRLREAGYAGPLVLLDDDPGSLLAAGASLEGAIVIGDAFPAEPGSAGERFAQAYAKKFGSPPSRHAATAYDAVVLVAAGLRQALADRPGTVGGTRLREALLAVRRVASIYGGELQLRDDGTVSRPLALFRVEGGALTFVRYVEAGKPS